MASSGPVHYHPASDQLDAVYTFEAEPTSERATHVRVGCVFITPPHTARRAYVAAEKKKAALRESGIAELAADLRRNWRLHTLVGVVIWTARSSFKNYDTMSAMSVYKKMILLISRKTGEIFFSTRCTSARF